MAISRPTTKTIISTSGWGVPITDEVNRMTPLVIAPTAWVNASYLNGWSTFPGYQPAAYRKIGDIVYLRGVIANGTMNTDAFYLPTGFRPPSDLLVPQLASGPNAAVMIVRASTGGVIPQVYATGGSNAWFTISTFFSI